ncbi:MAG: HAMP domain-containing protein [Acidobacteria bacterium]|nr:MAG: HAMP domain-containing protein [Acidobacteriota bacterium]
MTQRLLRARRPTAIATRLAVLIATVTVALLLAAALGMYWVFTASLVSEDRRFLLAKLDVLRVILAHLPDNPMALEEEVTWEGGASAYVPFFARVVEAGGRVMRETPGMARVAPVAAFPAPPERSGPAFGAFRSDGHRYVLAAGWSSPAHGGEPLRLQVALDTSRDQALLASYRHGLLAVVCIGALAAVAGGVAVARRGMHPLGEIVRSVRDVSSRRLDARVGETQWPVELRELAAAFDAMLDRLQDAFTRLSQFSANLAHELRTPIATLRGATEVALSRARSGDEYRELLTESLEQYDRLAQMIDGLLFVARAESGETSPARTCLDAATEVATVCEFFAPLADERGVRVEAGGSTTVWADTVLLRRALSNLLANALQYSAAGGVVRVEVGGDGAGGVLVSVADAGCGIPPDELPHVFDRFYRGRRARVAHPEGSGLGLALVHSIMELHGGRATVTSEIGRGTTVTLWFPPCLGDEYPGAAAT